MPKNFGLAERHDEEKRAEFWTGFIAGGVSAAFSLAVIIGIVVWNLPVS